MKVRPPLLNEIITLATRQKKSGLPLQALFDLDSTLFDVSPRITAILHAFAEQPEVQNRYPRECALLKKITPQPGDYGVRRTLERFGFKPSDEEFLKTLVPFWKKQFFGSDFLKFDVPYPGAVGFVRDLFNAGADIFYLTGRDVPRMFRGTLESLKQWDFPVSPSHANLHLKPSTDESDSDFKRDFFLKMERTFPEVWFFENEPTNIHLVLDHTPHIRIVFVETVHSGKTPPPGAPIPRIQGFET